MWLFQDTRAAFATRFTLTAICVAVAAGTGGLIYRGMLGTHWFAISVAFVISSIWAVPLALTLWGLARQEKQTAVLNTSASIYGIAGTTPPAAAATSFAAKPKRGGKSSVN